jgi:SAM-dependent methyltransferase
MTTNSLTLRSAKTNENPESTQPACGGRTEVLGRDSQRPAEVSGTHSAPKIDEPAYFDRLAEIERRHWWSQGMWRLAEYWLSDALAGRESLSGLDVGCGTGLTAVRLAGLAQLQHVVGLEPSADALSWAQRHQFPLARGSALSLPFHANAFDVVTCFDVLQHLPPGGDVRAAMEFHRVLRPGGLVLIRANGRGWLKSSGGPLAYRLEDLGRAVEQGGLRVLKGTYANFLPSVAQEVRGRLPRLTRHRVQSHPAGGGLQIRIPAPAINRAMRGLSSLEAVVAGRLNRKLPFGHSTLLLAERAT